jgi:glycosyltransferase involved in cell wall biosynthesis
MVLGLGTEQTKKHEVLVLTLKHDETLPDYEEKNGIKIHRMPEIPVLKRRYTIPKKGYEQKLKDIDPDVIITHARFFMPSYLAGRYSRKHGKKWIHVEHSADFIRSKNLVIHSGARVIDLIFGKWIFKNSDQVVVLSEKARQFVQNFSGRSMGVSIIRNGIEVPYKTPYNLPMNKKALFLGRMVEEKGIFYILEAAKKSPYKGLIASGWQTCAYVMRELVEHYFSPVSSLGSPGIDELRWILPVRPGDKLMVRATTIETKLSRSKPDRGIVRTFIEAINQQQEVVMSFKSVNFMLCRKKT